MTACRLPQPPLGPHTRAYQRDRAYDPQVPSDGATLDTDRGPVDLVAVTRALAGIPTDLTVSEAAYAISLLPASSGTAVEVAAVGLGISAASVGRAVVRLHVASRAKDPSTDQAAASGTDTTERTRA
jgi:hypothetical protein